MIRIHLPGREQVLELTKLVLDVNGTLATDGILEDGVKERLEGLKGRLDIFLLTADTFGTGADIAEELGIEVFTVDEENAAQDKEDFVRALEGGQCAAIGNGYNDHLMFEAAELSIAVIGREGASCKSIMAADIVVNSIQDALDLIGIHARLIATLRG